MEVERRKRVVGVVSALAIIASISFIATYWSKGEVKPLPGPTGGSEGREQLFAPIGPGTAPLKVLVFLPFDKVCPSCVKGAREVFQRIAKEQGGKVRFEFVDLEGKKKAEIRRLVKALKAEGIPFNPKAETWLLIGDRVRFKVGGRTVLFDELPSPSGRGESLLREVIRQEVERLSGGGPRSG